VSKIKFNGNITRAVLGIVALSLVVSQAEAGWVKAESKVWKNGVRRSHSFKKAMDYGDSGYAYASFDQSYANAREWWEYSGNQYNRRNWTTSYAQSNKYAAHAAAWWSSFLGPDENDVQWGPDSSYSQKPAFEFGNSTNLEVQYFETPGGILNRLSPDTFAKVSFTTLRKGETAMSELRYIIDGQASVARIAVSSDATGNLSLSTRVTGVFKDCAPMVDFDGTGQVIMRFAAREFYTGGSLNSMTILESCSQQGTLREMLDWNDGRNR
jgi:hypothetical protein